MFIGALKLFERMIATLGLLLFSLVATDSTTVIQISKCLFFVSLSSFLSLDKFYQAQIFSSQSEFIPIKKVIKEIKQITKSIFIFQFLICIFSNHFGLADFKFYDLVLIILLSIFSRIDLYFSFLNYGRNRYFQNFMRWIRPHMC